MYASYTFQIKLCTRWNWGFGEQIPLTELHISITGSESSSSRWCRLLTCDDSSSSLARDNDSSPWLIWSCDISGDESDDWGVPWYSSRLLACHEPLDVLGWPSGGPLFVCVGSFSLPPAPSSSSSGSFLRIFSPAIPFFGAVTRSRLILLLRDGSDLLICDMLSRSMMYMKPAMSSSKDRFLLRYPSSISWFVLSSYCHQPFLPS